MKYRDLQIQTQREFPSNMRTEGFGWLVRGGYLTRENEILPLGKQAIEHLKSLASQPNFHFTFVSARYRKSTGNFLSNCNRLY